MRTEAEPLFANREDTRATLFDHADRNSNPQTDF